MSGDSWRPPHAPPAKRGPSLQDRMTAGNDRGGDSYRPRPQVPRGDFTFTAGDRAPQFSADRNLDSGPGRRRRANNGPRPRQHTNNSAALFEGNRGRPRNFGGRGGRRGNFHQREHPTERPLLQLRDGSSPEHTMGVADGSSKFRDPDELSEGDAPMDTDDQEEEPQAKAVRTLSNARPDGDSVPKWSNPDPYTSMPPPTTSSGKDFVSLIRRAKKQEEDKKALEMNPVAANNDFISFDDDDDDDANAEEDENPVPIPRGSGPRPPPSLAGPPATRSASFAGSLNDLGAESRREGHPFPDDVLPSKPQFPARPGNAQVPTGPGQAQLPGRPSHKRKRGDTYGLVLPEWQMKDGSPTPWYTIKEVTRDSRLKNHMNQWLHNEIMDFYDYVKPTEDDQQVRIELQQDIIRTLRNNLPKTGSFSRQDTIHCFGSFPVNLHLPTADLDLVILTKEFANGGSPVFPTYGASKVLRLLGTMFVKKGIAGSFEVVPWAKVPILKFVDRDCNIKVDISFDNMNGTTTQDTYRKWINECTDMCHLVALVKQFLLMRGMNEVHTGGLGGYSVICLCVFFLKISKKVYGDLGTMFLDFLDYYGNKFDLRSSRIVVDPPALVAKTHQGIDGRAEKPDGLSIQDPDNSTNNISGGSHKVQQIFQEFSNAHAALLDRMDGIRTGSIRPSSVLHSILGGNYESYSKHRALVESFRK
ncbi:hypothetical protein P154DRAFT_535386 [Amniculicola lignicola CBS 123094]|uniref:polynucleotide adenylyltransferase n=1 Tax=Amniculicola lignicola CBS 123094 TaxID=1392246 RepID=A0A6A5WD98_9PLEO|nr:hypothetical protein P154DRAFT_535386 [Amniculicola lignicola CBS 123094]